MSASPKRKRRTSSSQTAKTKSSGRSSRQRSNQPGARAEVLLTCPADECGRTYKTQRGLDGHVEREHPAAAAVPARSESPTEAVERFLTEQIAVDGEIPAKVAVLAADVRVLAKALEDCDPGDKAKTSKEVTARTADLLALADVGDSDDDWTTG